MGYISIFIEEFKSSNTNTKAIKISVGKFCDFIT